MTIIEYTCVQAKYLTIIPLLAILITACSVSTSINTPPSSQLTPTAIIVRNHSGINFASASLSSLPDNKHKARAFGQLAPIPNGIEQVYGRASRAPALPLRVEFSLQTLQGKAIRQEFELNAIAQAATHFSKPYVLVFEIKPGMMITPLIETAR